MFEKNVATEPATEPENDERGGNEMKLVACGRWGCAVAVVGRELRFIGAGAHLSMRLPRGHVVAAGADGPTLVMADGAIWVWNAVHSKWDRAGNLFGPKS